MHASDFYVTSLALPRVLGEARAYCFMACNSTNCANPRPPGLTHVNERDGGSARSAACELPHVSAILCLVFQLLASAARHADRREVGIQPDREMGLSRLAREIPAERLPVRDVEPIRRAEVVRIIKRG